MHRCGLNFNIRMSWNVGNVQSKREACERDVHYAKGWRHQGDENPLLKKLGKQRVLPDWWNISVTQHLLGFPNRSVSEKICTAGFFSRTAPRARRQWAMGVARCAIWNELFRRWAILPKLNIKTSLKKDHWIPSQDNPKKGLAKFAF